MTYRHCIAEGTPYELGYALGTQLLEDQALIKDLTTPLFGGEPLPKAQTEDTAAQFEKFIPGINEEIKGFSDAAQVSYLDMVIYSSYLNVQGGCSHFVVLQNTPLQKRVYHAHNYDFGFDETPVLITARRRDKTHSTGFGCKIFGRFDGMNSQGLCVTTSSADVNHTGAMGGGFIFPMAVRAMLERCASAYEARELFMEMPFAEYRNFLLSDRYGAAILIEASPKRKSQRSIHIDDLYGFLCSADHFILDACEDIKPVAHSRVRQQKMEEVLSQEANLSMDSVKALLSKRYPQGLAFPYYEGGMGTLWSLIYEPLTATQSVCYGSPENGVWTAIDPNGKPGCTKTEIPLTDIAAPGDLWE